MWEEMICIYRDSYPTERDGYGYICAHFISAKNRYCNEWMISSTPEKNIQLMESINSYAVVYGYQNDQYYVKERCRLMLESIEKFISNENVQYPETLKEGMYLVSMVNKLPLLLNSNGSKEVELLEKQMKQYFDDMDKNRKDNSSVKLLMFKFYADIFTYYANQRNASKAEEYYELAQDLNKSLPIIKDFIMFYCPKHRVYHFIYILMLVSCYYPKIRFFCNSSLELSHCFIDIATSVANHIRTKLIFSILQRCSASQIFFIVH
jgi:hypothetical protein